MSKAGNDGTMAENDKLPLYGGGVADYVWQEKRFFLKTAGSCDLTQKLGPKRVKNLTLYLDEVIWEGNVIF